MDGGSDGSHGGREGAGFFVGGRGEDWGCEERTWRVCKWGAEIVEGGTRGDGAMCVI